MSRAQTCASILGLGLMLSAASTEARELEFFVESRLGADSNVFRRADESELPETAGGVWELAPRLTVRDEQDELHYSLSYQPTHEQFFALEDGRDAGDISGFDHNANGTFEWMADPTTRINLDGSFFRQRRVREEFVGVPAAADPVLDASDNEYLQRGRGTLSFYRQLAPRFSVRASVSHDNFDAERSDQSDSISHSGSAGFDYSLAEHTKVGVTGTYRYRDTKASIDRNPLPPVPGNDNITYEEFRSNTQTVDLSFSLEQQVTEHLSVVLAAGPSFFQTRDEQSSARDPDPLFGGGSGPLPDTFLTFNDDQSVFALARVNYSWQRGRLDVSYQRSEGGGGGTTAAATIVDSLSIAAMHQPTREWTLRSSFNWNQRNALSTQAFFGLDTRVAGYAASITAERRITRHLEISGRFFFGWTNRDEFRAAPIGNPGLATNGTSDTRIMTGTLFIRYTFEPYVF